MPCNHLSFFQKFLIRWTVKREAQRNLIHLIQDPESPDKSPTYIRTPSVSNWMSSFQQKKANYFKCHRRCIHFPHRFFPYFRIMPFSAGLECLNKITANLLAKHGKMESEYSLKKEHLKDAIHSSQRSQKKHLTVRYQEMLNDAEAFYHDETVKLYKKLIALESEKIRLLETAESHLEAIRERHLARVLYFLAQASSFCPPMTRHVFTRSNVIAAFDANCLGRFGPILKEHYQLRAKFTEELQNLHKIPENIDEKCSSESSDVL